MKTSPTNQGPTIGNRSKSSSVTRKMLQTRTRSLALIAGHEPPHVTQADYQQAKQELRKASKEPGRRATARTTAEILPVHPAPSAERHQMAESPNEDDDRDRHNASEQLAEAGIERRLQSDRAARTAESSIGQNR
jgi:hypothetical protein